MSIGKVTAWKMTEEERLSYIAKHPIVPTEKPSGFSNANIIQVAPEKKSKYKRLITMDSVNKDKLHRLFMEGKTINQIAETLNITVSIVKNYIQKERNQDPKKWPPRKKVTKL